MRVEVRDSQVVAQVGQEFYYIGDEDDPNDLLNQSPGKTTGCFTFEGIYLILLHTIYRVYNNISNTMGATCGAGSVYPS